MTQTERKAILRKARHINWSQEAEKFAVSVEEYKLLRDWCGKELQRIHTLTVVDGELRSTTSRTRVSSFPEGSYEEYTPDRKRAKYHCLYIHKGGRYLIVTTRKDGKEPLDVDCFAEVELRFARNHPEFKTNSPLIEAFGRSEYSVRECIPSPMYYLREDAKSASPQDQKVLDGLSSLDGVSQYPTAGCGLLPTTTGSVRVPGRVPPNEEYPFALYLTSGHVAVFGEFDTHDWISHPLATKVIYNTEESRPKLNWLKQFDDAEEETWLLRASDYTLAGEMQHFFQIKETYDKNSPDPEVRRQREIAKLIMNAFIGCLHMKTKVAYARRPFAHLAAVIIARANNALIHKIEKIKLGDIIHVCVDGCIYQGSYDLSTVGSKSRRLGQFEQEFTNAEGVFRGINQYVIRDEERCIKTAHSGYTHLREDLRIDDAEDLRFDDIWHWMMLDVNEDYYKYKDYTRGGI